MIVTMPDAPTSLRAARVVRPHGVRGEVRAEPCGGEWDRFVPGMRVDVENAGRALTIRTVRPAPGGLVLLAFDEVHDPIEAAALRGQYLCVGLGSARPLGDDEWFVWQLIGLRVVTDDGAPAGIVDDIETGVVNDVLVVRDGELLHRLPMARAFVLDVDLDGGVMTVARWVEETV